MILIAREVSNLYKVYLKRHVSPIKTTETSHDPSVSWRALRDDVYKLVLMVNRRKIKQKHLFSSIETSIKELSLGNLLYDVSHFYDSFHSVELNEHYPMVHV